MASSLSRLEVDIETIQSSEVGIDQLVFDQSLNQLFLSYLIFYVSLCDLMLFTTSRYKITGLRQSFVIINSVGNSHLSV